MFIVVIVIINIFGSLRVLITRPIFVIISYRFVRVIGFIMNCSIGVTIYAIIINFICLRPKSFSIVIVVITWDIRSVVMPRGLY